MIYFEYCKEGAAFSDFTVEQDLRILLNHYAEDHKKKDLTFKFSTENFCTMLRCLVKRGEVSKDDVILKFQNQIILIQEDGLLEHWPLGFCDFTDQRLNELVEWSFEFS